MFSNEGHAACVNAVSASKFVKKKVGQALLNKLSSQKRRARDFCFTALGFWCLHFYYAPHSHEQKEKTQGGINATRYLNI